MGANKKECHLGSAETKSELIKVKALRQGEENNTNTKVAPTNEI
jgi:hypothetical protein